MGCDMYKIGICDDGTNICVALEKMVMEYADRNKLKAEVQLWSAGEDLCGYLERGGQLDILFLDIELVELTGIQVGGFIRNKMEDRGMQIIYISNNSSYAQELFKTQPMDFLVKPITAQQMEEALDLAIKLLENKKAERFEFQSGRDYYYIPYSEIIYFESVGRKIKIVTVNQENKEFYGSIRELEKKLSKDFLAIHQSYIINKDHVLNYAYETVKMENNETLTISKAYRRQVREKLLRR
ncbi:MAG: LytTR family DNA-binding domain-containing protein [Butyrivibrio sp.]|nr:LytTR family DNA-binding domain-containing protein [Muribaculum sp.]MCM1552653.1 LytTR family DNA-binding domain-containing protein [Butyrivibrio sp.]